MDFFSIMAEDKIRRALEKGEFDNLPGQGKPLKLDDNSHVPKELRMAYSLLKNANMLDEYDALRQEMMTIDKLIEACQDEEDQTRLKQQRNEKQLRFDALLKKRRTMAAPASAYYKERVLDRIKKKDQK